MGATSDDDPRYRGDVENPERLGHEVDLDHPDALRAAAITALQDLLLDTPAIEEFVGHVVQVAARRLGEGTEATITLMRNGRLSAVAASDARASRCDEIEYADGHGPCLESIRTGTALVVPDLRSDLRWPVWGRQALAQGFVAAAAIPRRVLDGIDVALNLYADRPHAWDAGALALADVYADELGRSLTLAVRSADLRTANEDLRHALASRAVIDQALGILMAQNRCGADDAFAMLRGASQHRNVKLREVARSIVDGITRGPKATERSSATFTDRPE